MFVYGRWSITSPFQSFIPHLQHVRLHLGGPNSTYCCGDQKLLFPCTGLFFRPFNGEKAVRDHNGDFFSSSPSRPPLVFFSFKFWRKWNIYTLYFLNCPSAIQKMCHYIGKFECTPLKQWLIKSYHISDYYYIEVLLLSRWELWHSNFEQKWGFTLLFFLRILWLYLVLKLEFCAIMFKNPNTSVLNMANIPISA